MKIIVHAVFPLVALAGLLFGCSKESPGSAQTTKRPTVPITVARAESKDVPIELRNIGNVEAYATVTIRSQITGQIVKIHFQEGQEVKQGDLLFTIDPRPSEGALRQAEADLKRDQAQLVSVRLEFDRQKKLFESNIASKDDYDKAEAAFHALEASIMADEASVSRAKLNVEFTAIRAPITGRTGNLMVKQGNIVKAPDDALVTINQVQPIYVTFSVPEQDLPAIRKQMRTAPLSVQIEAPSGNLREDAANLERGDLTFIDNSVDATTARIKLKATLPNKDNALWPGQFVQAVLLLDTIRNATVVPSQAVQASQNGDFVFVVQDNSKVQKRTVTAGLSNNGFTVLETGVRAGETVVLDGQLRLADGSVVTISSGNLSDALNAPAEIKAQ
ncbi:MAG TPA: efflux RND transporter periplasmic adaptor subunit [Candidatus Dormibacteraeota bacterium]|nr:efflux RND transporter periplasmic adaptor subunit [Candidatus Dormibacteraeota bacterium]